MNPFVPPLADATGGDPPASVLQFSPHLGAALLAQPDCVSSVWPAFGDLRSAARATKPSRFRLVVSATTSEARLVFGACFEVVWFLLSLATQVQYSPVRRTVNYVPLPMPYVNSEASVSIYITHNCRRYWQCSRMCENVSRNIH